MATFQRKGLPKIPAKIRHSPAFSPTDFLSSSEYRRTLPRKAILIYSDHLYKIIREWSGSSLQDYPYKGRLMENISSDGNFIILKLPPGSAFTAAVAEEIHALGVEEMIVLGTAGSISRTAPIGSLILCERALRDEGVSYHYIPPSLYSYPSKKLTLSLKEKVSSCLGGIFFGPTWTTDAVYMETRFEIETYSKMGILTVEMEASALFAVGRRRGFHTAAVFAVSDELFGDNWSGIVNDLESMHKLSEIAKIFSVMSLDEQSVGGEI